MSDTIRIYNRKVKKAHRIDLSKPRMGLKEQVETGEIRNPLRNAVHDYGLVYHPYASWLCMGHCPMCRDHDKDQRRLRKVRKREFMNILYHEQNNQIRNGHNARPVLY